MIRRRPDLLALIVALVSTLAIVAFVLGNLILSRDRELDLGIARTGYFGAMLGEHTARTVRGMEGAMESGERAAAEILGQL